MKLGFERALLPIAGAGDHAGVRPMAFRTLGQFVDHILGRG